MAKRIVVLSDGTGNSASQVWRTNVWRTFESLDLTGSDQVAFYDDGVGTSSFKPLAILGGAFGYGLKRNVIEIYKFVCRNFRTGQDNARAYVGDDARETDFVDDEIYGFGFSRGAFTIRVVVGLILDQGLVDAKCEAELDALATEAYRNYRARHFKTRTGIERPFRAIRDWFLGRKHADQLPNVRRVDQIRFLGLWDTDAAYGLPVDEMTRGVSRYLWPLELPNKRLDPSRIARACHAISLDDQRTTFHPVLWDESNMPPIVPGPATVTKQEKLTQIWFAGVHSNVGGGYPDDSLAYIPMYWVWKEAKDCGLKFKSSPSADPDAFLAAQSKEDKDGRLYDSRSGLGGYYRYGPRDVDQLCDSGATDERDFVKIAAPKIHESVFRRIAMGAHSYAPVGLPKRYEIVAYNAKSGDHRIIRSAQQLPEHPDGALSRYKEQDAVVWSTIWRGRGVYFLTVLASLFLAIYPLAYSIPATSEFATRLRFLSDTIRLVAVALPSAANRWVDAYARDPGLFVVSALSVIILLALSAGLRARITDQMRARLVTSLTIPNNLPAAPPVSNEWRPAGWLEISGLVFLIAAAIYGLLINPFPWPYAWIWKPLSDLLAKFSIPSGFIALIALVVLLFPTKRVHALRSAPTYKTFIRELRLRYAPTFFAIAFCVLGVVMTSHYLFNIEDSFGNFCQATLPNDPGKAVDQAGIKQICYDKNLKNCTIDTSAIDPRGGACRTASADADKCTGKTTVFDTRALCASTGIFVEKNARYHLLVSKSQQLPGGAALDSEQSQWRFAWAKSDFRGQTLAALGAYDDTSCGSAKSWEWLGHGAHPLHVSCNYLAATSRQLFGMFAYFPKRSLDRPLGSFILRYGSTGNEENFIDADAPPASGDRLSEPFAPTRNGELYVYLNKPASGLWPDVAHNLNSGFAKVTVIRIPPKP
ncbi:hypothetical protein XH99_00265 [Bradyrhizobium nanningense]|uniref:T6SS Phospholipase effector Tle1-like catalytic domain-containing protein n=1 Tax=Bradyrhizobium nanningense TaxID=1325118 RepID=A0A4Q0SJI2_9BRAD|nr:DUF2235 domain-containing protein [Bradyrhizobium nanningense]RXH38730.1 hypothetical protein XH99_00265 [Bradyrhizobium nanningense]